MSENKNKNKLSISNVEEGFNPTKNCDGSFTLKSFNDRVTLTSRTCIVINYGCQIQSVCKYKPYVVMVEKYAEKGVIATAFEKDNLIFVRVYNIGKEIVVFEKDDEFANLYFSAVKYLNI